MKHNRNRAVKKERLNKNVKLNVATNFALAFLIFSVGFVCLFPVEDAVTTDGSETNVYRSASAQTDGVSLMFNVYCYNNQPGVVIDYATGASRAS